MKPHVTVPAAVEILNVLGCHTGLRLTGEATGGAYTLVEVVNEPGTGIPPHIHTREDEIFHVLEGEVEFTVGDQTSVALAGTSAFLPRGIPHGFRAVGDQPARMLVAAQPAGIEHMFRRLAALPAGPPDMAAVTAICADQGIRFI